MPTSATTRTRHHRRALILAAAALLTGIALYLLLTLLAGPAYASEPTPRPAAGTAAQEPEAQPAAPVEQPPPERPRPVRDLIAGVTDTITDVTDVLDQATKPLPVVGDVIDNTTALTDGILEGVTQPTKPAPAPTAPAGPTAPAPSLPDDNTPTTGTGPSAAERPLNTSASTITAADPFQPDDPREAPRRHRHLAHAHAAPSPATDTRAAVPVHGQPAPHLRPCRSGEQSPQPTTPTTPLYALPDGHWIPHAPKTTPISDTSRAYTGRTQPPSPPSG